MSKNQINVITLANHEGNRQYSDPIKPRSNNSCWRKARENTHGRVTIGFGFTFDWIKKARRFWGQSCSVVDAEPTTCQYSEKNRSWCFIVIWQQTSSPMYLASCVLRWAYLSFMSSWYILWSSLINWSFMSKALPQHARNSLKHWEKRF